MTSPRRSSTAFTNGHRGLALCAWLAAASVLPTGCGPQFVRAPDSPMLILKAEGRVKIAMMHEGEMIEAGWIDAAEIEGQTVVQYDWTEP